MKKIVLKLDLRDDDKSKKKAMQIVTGISGVDSVSVEMKEKKLTVIGEIDVVEVVSKLRKLCHTEIISVGPAKEPEKKKEEAKKPDAKKGEEVAPAPIFYYGPYHDTQLRNLKGFNPQTSTQTDATTSDNDNDVVLSFFQSKNRAFLLWIPTSRQAAISNPKKLMPQK
ncbi:heavy metal-associated isoprenylated plant protein 12-like isoform X1 [Carica papaya]|uniref:heavy metal-associated isoprenylated plant protein 12-like isoform X1 n=1 Tax=Carica papaya TaxID=3649 RepID=UPI000B8C8549|nr:heavy metal-associated isoprenylated plant protein 12-like isoform X1 [Carica papaya]XP_021892071.1 heavy metal-associated isoprenylated plant protein 12-like isoform X1 [Carica papaya]XP_021892072.1 heavy metal-associated isoprenylated plant protein 12-like isoform X1 [Carica papaya]XP_021892075.1 heavy metal-associated isoprenylated plant protein 12-like isoform X1 [Carica papaya]